jgi:hypothetical protein
LSADGEGGAVFSCAGEHAGGAADRPSDDLTDRYRLPQGVVPVAGSTGIGSVRAKLMPPTIAAQALRRDVVGLVEDENQLISDQLSVEHFERPG